MCNIQHLLKLSFGSYWFGYKCFKQWTSLFFILCVIRLEKINCLFILVTEIMKVGRCLQELTKLIYNYGHRQLHRPTWNMCSTNLQQHLLLHFNFNFSLHIFANRNNRNQAK
ncbi:unnamed protein product [Brassica napus]|uniref:(rape) hypothetical protein n=1 Tax=Brassica napus TaxID=3708 RepID=A0A816I1Z6_BRANA|nr:unnamed protein product [Brassica napus]